MQPPPTPADACNGPWAFSWAESGPDRAVCGEDRTQACETYNACTSWDRDQAGDGLGVQQDGDVAQGSFNGTYGCRLTGCTFDIDAHCVTEANNKRAALLLNVVAGAPDWARKDFTVTERSFGTGRDPDPDPDTGKFTFHYRCDFTGHKFPRQMTTPRMACSCAAFPARSCVLSSGATVTPPGQTRPSAGVPAAGHTRAFTSGPTCLTCDQLPVTSDASAQAKFDCLNNQLTSATGDLQSSLAARLELMLQLFGERLTPAQRTRAEQIYDDMPGSATSCRVPIAWDPACRTQAEPLKLPTQLQLCQDLVKNDHTSAAVSAIEFPHCLDELAKTAQLATTTCRLSTRDAADAAAQGVMGKSYPPLTGDLTAVLPTVMTRVNAWWPAATTAATGDPSWLIGHANSLLRQLWRNILQGQVPLPDGELATDEAAAALLADPTGTRFATDFDVLAALFAPGQSAPPPLLAMTGDALQPITARLERLEAIHDVGCRFAAGLDEIACRTVSGTTITLRSSATTELVHALSVLPDHDALASVLAAATRLATQQPRLFGALAQIRDQHSYFDLAWTALGRTEPFATLATIADPPPQAATLAAIVRAAAGAWSSYQSSGELIPWHKPRLTSATLQQPVLVGFIDTLLNQLVSDRSTYEAARRDTVNHLLAQSRQQGAIQSLVDRQVILRDQDIDLILRSLGMESREAASRASLAGYQAAFEALVASNALDGNAGYQVHTIAPFVASAADARYPGGSVPPDVTRDRFTAPITMHPGESLRLKVSGTWAPTCAVLNTSIQGPNGDFQPIGAPDAETGPEGYWVSLANDGFHAHSTAVNEDYRLAAGVSVKACVQKEQPFFKVEACVHTDFDFIHTNAGSESRGTDHRSTASFASGIHLPGVTPFPDAPTGSLLAVITPTDHPEQILDVRVVLRDDLILAPTPPEGLGGSVDVHLVVNDRGTCGASSSSQLRIEGAVSIPVGNVAQAVGAAMTSTLDRIEGQAPAILAQGQLTAEEATALRTQAWTLVQQGVAPLGLGLAGLPYDLRQLFDSFLEAEIASVARRSQMNAITHERKQLELQGESVAHEAAFADDQDRLLLLMPRFVLRDLTGVSLGAALDALSEALTTDVAQVFELRDPAAFSNFHTSVKNSISQLIDLNLTAPYENAIASFEGFARAVRNVVSQATFELPNTQRRTVAVAIPRAAPVCTVGCTYADFKSVSSTVARSFWSAMTTAPFRAGLTITPADLYSSAGAGSLSCGDVAPVMRRMAIYLDTGDSDIVLSSLLSEIRGVAAPAGSAVLFPRVGDVLSLEADSTDGVPLAVPALNGNRTQIVERFGPSQIELGTGAGLSPFTAFRFDMTPLQGGQSQQALAAASAVMIVFEVERRVSVPNVDVPGPCVPVL